MSSAQTYRLRASLAFGGSTALFTTYWGDSGLVGPVPVATEAVKRVRAMWNSLATRLPAATVLTIDNVLVQIDQTTGQPTGAFVGTAAAAVTFSGATDPLPLSTQVLAQYTTGIFIRGRALKGRSFLPFFDENASSSGSGPNSGTITAVNTALGLLGTTVTSAIDQLVWNRPNPAIPGSGQSEVITGRSCSSFWAVQKGRRP